jgi:hypothetical protein
MTPGPVNREDVVRVVRAFKVEVRELSNDWYEIRRWGAILEEIRFPPQVDPRHVVRLANKLKIPAHLFWHLDLLDEYVKLNAIAGPGS